jgi:hypothetical protein
MDSAFRNTHTHIYHSPHPYYRCPRRLSQTLDRCNKAQWRLHWRPVNVSCKINSFLKRKYTVCRISEMTHLKRSVHSWCFQKVYCPHSNLSHCVFYIYIGWAYCYPPAMVFHIYQKYICWIFEAFCTITIFFPHKMLCISWCYLVWFLNIHFYVKSVLKFKCPNSWPRLKL